LLPLSASLLQILRWNFYLANAETAYLTSHCVKLGACATAGSTGVNELLINRDPMPMNGCSTSGIPSK
jgi:hypothetical protein